MPDDKQNTSGDYKRFFAMIGTSMLLMYIMTYLNSYKIIDHARFSETRLFMTLMMGAVMTLVMLTFMRKMYRNSRTNVVIVLGAIGLFAAALWLVRSQVTVNDAYYMKGMIPHHSIAILTSERAEIKDLRVRKLADGIIEAQRKEIQEMEWLIEDIKNNGAVTSQDELETRPLPAFSSPQE